MADSSSSSYLSIGEVLSLLVEEFPDVTISKIRFLESQGLISPERTPSGYRKFYDEDVDLLRVILTEQRQNYLPLRVIKKRLDNGEIDPTGEHLRPAPWDPDNTDETRDIVPPADVPAERVAAHPSSGTTAPAPADPEPAPRLMPGVLLDRREFCAMVGISDAELADLESFGVVAPSRTTGTALYGDDAVAIAQPALVFLRAGIEARHLRQWRTAADREVSLYEQLITPHLRHRNPEARASALAELRRLETVGGQLRAALVRGALGHVFER